MEIPTETLGKTVLFIENDAAIVPATTRALGAAGFEVVHTASGEEAFAYAGHDESVVDILVLDILAEGGRDGVATAREILAERDVPVVFFASRTDGVSLDRAAEIPAWGYVPKECGTSLLVFTVSNALRHVRDQRKLERHTSLLRESEGEGWNRQWLLQNAIDSSADLIYVKDREHRVVLCNIVFATAVGSTPDEVVGKSDVEVLRRAYESYPEFNFLDAEEKFLRKLRADNERVLQGETIHTVDHLEASGTGANGDGSGNVEYATFTFDTVKAPFRDRRGKIVGVMTVSRDISDRLRLEREVSEIQSDFQRFFELGPDPMCTLTVDGVLGMVSEAWVRTLGIPRSALEGHSIYDYLHPEDVEPTRELLHRLSRGEVVQRFVNRYRTTDGSYRTFAWNVTIGDNATVFAAARDITDEQTALNRLVQSEERLNLALRNTGVGVWDWDLRRDQVYFSPEWYSMLGYDETEPGGSYETWRALWHPDDAEMVRRAVDDHLAGKTESYEVIHRLRHKEGGTRWVMTRGHLMRDDEGQPRRWIGTNTDITRQKEIEGQLQQALEANRVILRELQHRVKNNLNMVSSLLSLAEPKVSDGAAKKVLAETRQRIRTISDIYAKLHRQGGVDHIDLGRYLPDLVSSIVSALRRDDMHMELDIDVEPVETDIQTAVAVGLITNELVTNAAKHAFRDRDYGTLTVRLEPVASGSSSPDEGSLLRLVVADDGVGMPAFSSDGDLAGGWGRSGDGAGHGAGGRGEGATGDDPPDEDGATGTSDGLMLIQLLAEQLEGTVSFTPATHAGGTSVVVEFPPPAAER